MTASTRKNPEMRGEVENSATADKTERAKPAKQPNLDTTHDTMHEIVRDAAALMARDGLRHGKAFECLLNRYFGK